MPAAVQFDDQPRLCAVEIRDVVPNGLLPLEANGVMPQEFIPQLPFPRGHVLPQGFRKGDVRLVVWLHGFPFRCLGAVGVVLAYACWFCLGVLSLSQNLRF